MNAMFNAVAGLADEEKRKDTEFPQFKSIHEGIAVISQRFDGVTEEANILGQGVADMWDRVKKEQMTSTTAQINYNSALYLACQAISVAAMCAKMMEFIDSQEKGGEEDEQAVSAEA